MTDDGLFELNEDAVSARRVDEGYLRALGPGPRLLVDQPCAPRLQLCEGCGDIVDTQRDVVEPRPPFVDVLGDGGIGRRRFQELEIRLADRDETRPHSL